MPTVAEIADYFENRVPVRLKSDFDNAGLLVGITVAEVKRVLVALDITDDVISEAISFGAELIVSHHPVFFELKSITDSDSVGRKAVRLLTNKISAICLHTNLDSVGGGVNDVLMSKLGGRVTGVLLPAGEYPDGIPYGIGRTGKLPAPVPFERFAETVKSALKTTCLKCHNAGRDVEYIACCGGSGGDELDAAVKAGCDTYVTSDIKYHRFLYAKEYGINLIDGDHFSTENVVIPVISGMLREAFRDLDVKISETHKQTAVFC
ncbi:MAG: Nif3-like dinuclear metal center hexameric protein [Oscillospiraceae bacterium]|nr:Nif3-like dinuclear metal center hexameric protein [Oscillospiraceae bacterium]